MGIRVLCINPGSTSTRLAVFEDEKRLFITNVAHSNEFLEQFHGVQEQLEYRYSLVEKTLKDQGIDISAMDAVVGRGGALRPMEGGIFSINENMLQDCMTSKYAEHPSNLGCQLAKRFADSFGLPCFVVDPPLVDEFGREARASGFEPIKRVSAFHALNEKIVARYMAEELGKGIEETNLITVHLGSGISVTAQKKGQCVDNTYGSGGDGPFSPERAGRMPVLNLLKMMSEDPDFETRTWKKLFSKESGLVSYLGTNDVLEITARMEAGDASAKETLDGMAYMIAKEIAAYATIMNWEVDAVGITGAIARSSYITDFIKERVEFIAPVMIYPGEFEMEGLAGGGIRALTGKEQVKTY
jgi:butyrate kinase